MSWVNGRAKDEWSELLRRGKISLSWEKAARREAHRRLIKSKMRDPAFEAKRIEGTKRANQKRMPELKNFKGRFHPNHPHPPLPPMSAAERRRYRYLRDKSGSREASLEVIMIERQERPTACTVNPFEVGHASHATHSAPKAPSDAAGRVRSTA